MSTLVATAHPDPSSLTHHVADRLLSALADRDVTVAHLAQEGFDPRFTAHDRQGYLGHHDPAPDVVAEQRRLDGASDLVLVFPVYWWSMPALLKGWIDRVFIAGWAFDYDDDRVTPKLQGLTIHLLPISGTAEESFARHGYARSFTTQIELGVVDFCGARRGATAFVHDSESDDRDRVARDAETVVAAVVDAVRAG